MGEHPPEGEKKKFYTPLKGLLPGPKKGAKGKKKRRGQKGGPKSPLNGF